MYNIVYNNTAHCDEINPGDSCMKSTQGKDWFMLKYNQSIMVLLCLLWVNCGWLCQLRKCRYQLSVSIYCAFMGLTTPSSIHRPDEIINIVSLLAT